MKNFIMTILLLKLKIFCEYYLRNIPHLWFNTSLFFNFADVPAALPLLRVYPIRHNNHSVLLIEKAVDSKRNFVLIAANFIIARKSGYWIWFVTMWYKLKLVIIEIDCRSFAGFPEAQTPKTIFPTLWEIPNMPGTVQTYYEDLRKKFSL